MGHSVRVRREEEKGTISWKIKFRNGTTKDFVSPITTKPWGKHIPKLAEKEKPSKEELLSNVENNQSAGSLKEKEELSLSQDISMKAADKNSNEDTLDIPAFLRRQKE